MLKSEKCGHNTHTVVPITVTWMCNTTFLNLNQKKCIKLVHMFCKTLVLTIAFISNING